MPDTAMLMSELPIRKSKEGRKPASVRHGNASNTRLARAGIVFLAAFLMTALWAPILYFGGVLLGLPVDGGILLRILVVIFCLSVLGVALAVSIGEASAPSRADAERAARRAREEDA